MGGTALGAASGSVFLDISQAMGAADQLTSKLGAVDRASGNFGASGAAGMETLQQRATRLNATYGLLGKGLVGVGVAIGGAFGAGIFAAAGFEQAMDGVGASLGGVGTATGITKDQMSALNSEALRIGATTSKSASEAATAMDLLAKAGLGVDAILNGGAQAAVNLSEATGEQLPQAAESAAAAMLLFKNENLDAARVADIYATGLNNSSATLSEFQTGVARLAPVIAATGMSFEDSSALIAYFNSQGLAAAEVGTSLTGVFNSLTNPTQQATDGIAALGLQVYDTNGAFVGMPQILAQVIDKTKDMTEEQRNLALGQIFTADSMDVLNLAIANGLGGYDAVRAGMDETGTAAANSAQRMDNLKGDVEQLKGSLETLGIVIGSKVLPLFRGLTQGVTGVLNGVLSLPGPVQTVAAGLLGLTGALAAGTGAALLAYPKYLQLKDSFIEISKGSGPAAKGVRAVGYAVRFAQANFIPLLIAIAIVTLAFEAFKHNWLGFGDLVRSIGGAIADTVRPVIETFTHLKDAIAFFSATGANPLQAVLLGIADTFLFLGLQRPWEIFTDLSRAVGEAVADFQNLRDLGINPVAAALFALDKFLGGFGNVPGLDILRNALRAGGVAAQKFGDRLSASARKITRAVGKITDAFGEDGLLGGFKAIFGRPGRQLLSAFGDALASPYKAVGDFLTGFKTGFAPLDGIINQVGRGFIDFGRLIQEVFQGDIKGALEVGERLFRRVWATILDAAGLAVSGLVALFRAIPWGDVWDALRSSAAAAFGFLGDVAGNIYSWARDQFNRVDWGGVWDAAVEGIKTVAQAGFDLGAWVINTGAPSVLGWIDEWKNRLWDYLKQALGIYRTQGDQTGGPESGQADIDILGWTIHTGIPNVIGWVKDYAQKAWDGLKVAVGWSTNVLGDLGRWFLNTAAPDVIGWVSGAAQDVWSYLKRAVHWSGNVLGDLGRWFLNTVAPDVLGWVSWAAAHTWEALKSAAKWVGGAVGDLGDWTLKTIGPTVSGWLESAVAASNVGKLLDAKMPTNAIGHLVSWTLDVAAPTSINGLGAAASAVWDKVAGALGTAVQALKISPFDLLDFGSKLGEGLRQGVETYFSLADPIGTALGRAIDAVDWSGPAGKTWAKIGVAILAVANAPLILAGAIGLVILGAIKGFLFPGSADFSTIATKLWDGIVTAVHNPGDAGTRLVSAIFDAVVGAANWTGAAWQNVAFKMGGALIDALKSVGTLGGDLITVVFDAMKGAANLTGDAFAGVGSAIAGAVWDAIKKAAAFWNWMDLVPDWAERFIDTAGDAVTKSMGGGDKSAGMVAASGKAAEALEGFSGRLAAVQGKVAEAFTGISTAAQISMTKVQLVTGLASSAVVSRFTTFGGQIVSSATRSFAQVAAAAQSGMGRANAAVGSGAAQISGRVSAMGSQVAASGASAFARFAAAAASGMQQAVGAAQTGANGIIQAIHSIGSMADFGRYIGGTLSSGIAEGIRSGIQAVADAAAATVNAATKAAHAAAGNPNSPSPVMWERVGWPLAQALFMPFLAAAPLIAAAAGGAVAGGLSAAQSAASAGSLSLPSIGGLAAPGAAGGAGGASAGSVSHYYDHRTQTVSIDGAGDPDLVAKRVIAKLGRGRGLARKP